MVMGNQVTDVLREIPHDTAKMMQESRHILYLPVRADIMCIIEMQEVENDETIVDFYSGLMSITLPFKHE